MKGVDLIEPMEAAASVIARLDARISASPLAEAWQVRACLQAAETLAMIDGTDTRVSDVLGLMVGAPLPSRTEYYPAHIGYGHWRRCIARVELSDLAERVIGRKVTKALRLVETQADWDLEASLPPAARAAMLGQAAHVAMIDDYALEVSNRALELLRGFERPGAVLKGLAAGIQEVVRHDPDPDYFGRIHDIRRQFERDARDDLEARLVALPSPAEKRTAQALRDGTDALIEAVVWDKKPHLGACYAVIPDRLQELGFTQNRLSCLTGATKRLGFDARLDDTAFKGFLRQLASEAKIGLAILDALEAGLARLATTLPDTITARSTLPDILYAVVLLPAVDTVWLSTSLDLQQRVVQKAFKRLADDKVIQTWGAKRSSALETRANEVRLWTLAGFDQAMDRSIRYGSVVRRPATGVVDPMLMFDRARDPTIQIPMSVVYERYQQQLVDLDREFGRFWEGKLEKKRPPQRRVQRDFGHSPSGTT